MSVHSLCRRFVIAGMIFLVLSPGLPVRVARAEEPSPSASASIFLVETEGWSGTGVLVDSSGLILTSAMASEAEHYFAVVVAPGRKVRAVKVASHGNTGLALIKVNPQAIAGLRPLPLLAEPAGAESKATKRDEPAEGDHLTALVGSAEGHAVAHACTVMKVRYDSLATDLKTVVNVEGAPLLNRQGQVVGWFAGRYATKKGMTATRAQKAAPLVAKALTEAATIPTPPATHLPTVPEKPFPPEALQKAATADLYLSSYQVMAKPFLITLITPPLVAAMQARASYSEGSGWYDPPPGPLSRSGVQDSCREAEGPTNRWSPMPDDKAPVVTIQVIPEIHRRPAVYVGVVVFWIVLPVLMLILVFFGGRPTDVPVARVSSRFDPAIDEIKLMRGGEEVMPIVPGRRCSPPHGLMPVQFCTPESGRSRKRRVKGCYSEYTFPIEAFAPGAPLELHVVTQNGGAHTHPLVVPLNRELVTLIWSDFAPFL